MGYRRCQLFECLPVITPLYVWQYYLLLQANIGMDRCPVTRSRYDGPPIRRASNSPHPVSMPLEGLADCSTSLSIPDSNGPIYRSGHDFPPVGRVNNRPNTLGMPL